MTPRKRFALSSGASVICLGLTSAAHAVCMSSDSSLGVGLPSISATEVSTAQVVEMVHQRQQEEQTAVPASTAPTAAEPAPAPAQGSPAPKKKAASASSSASSAAAAATEPVAKPKPKSKPVGASKPVSAAPPASKAEAEDDAPATAVASYSAGPSSYGVWTQGYGDYEHRSGLTIDVARPGEITRNQWSGGFLVGADKTFRYSSASGLTLGLFGGYNASHAKESAGVFRDQQGATTENFSRSDAKQDTNGGFLGAYAAYYVDRLAFQAVFKADLFHVRQSDIIQAQFDNGAACNLPQQTRTGEADLTNYITEVNGSYRIDLSSRSWLEPIAGFRVTVSDLGNQTGGLGFGGDGHIVRVQGGMRYSQIWPLSRGFLLTSLTGMLYSDVVVGGFETSGGQFSPATPVTDEGKLRVLGQFASRWDVGNGFSYEMQVEGRGGEHLKGIGGKLGARYEW